MNIKNHKQAAQHVSCQWIAAIVEPRRLSAVKRCSFPTIFQQSPLPPAFERALPAAADSQRSAIFGCFHAVSSPKTDILSFVAHRMIVSISKSTDFTASPETRST